jgi:transcriptional regulator with XRE-family HTH domain
VVDYTQEVFRMTIQEQIKQARKDKGLTQQQLADRLGVTQSTVGQYETNKEPPKVSTLAKIASALGISVSSLIGSGEANYIRIETQEDWDSVREWHSGARKLPADYEEAKRQLGTGEIRLKPSERRGGYAISYTTHDPLEDRLLESFGNLKPAWKQRAVDIVELFANAPECRKGE